MKQLKIQANAFLCLLCLGGLNTEKKDTNNERKNYLDPSMNVFIHL